MRRPCQAVQGSALEIFLHQSVQLLLVTWNPMGRSGYRLCALSRAPQQMELVVYRHQGWLAMTRVTAINSIALVELQNE